MRENHLPANMTNDSHFEKENNTEAAGNGQYVSCLILAMLVPYSENDRE